MRITFSRYFAALPKGFSIPLSHIEFSASRSSGPGGQNVNKVNTKSEIRFHVESATWIPLDVRRHFMEQQRSKINKDGEIVITSQEQRSQTQNREDCIEKLKEYLAIAFVEPKVRQVWEDLGEDTKLNRRKDKLHRSNVKSARRTNSFDD